MARIKGTSTRPPRRSAAEEHGAGAREGAPFSVRHIIDTTSVAFDDIAGAKTDTQRNRRMLGLP